MSDIEQQEIRKKKVIAEHRRIFEGVMHKSRQGGRAKLLDISAASFQFGWVLGTLGVKAEDAEAELTASLTRAINGDADS